MATKNPSTYKYGIYSCNEKKARSEDGKKKYNSTKALYNYFCNRVRGRKSMQLTQRKYSEIMKDINLSMITHLIEKPGTYINLPCNMGVFTIKTKVRRMFNKYGKLNHRLPINRVATFDLWNNNPQAKEDKVFIRILDPNRHIFTWEKDKCIVKNRDSYHFMMIQKITKMLSKHIIDNNRDIMYTLFNKNSIENIEYNKQCATLKH